MKLSQFLFSLVFFCFLVPPMEIEGQDGPEEISVVLEIPGGGVSEIDAIIKDQNLYLPVTDLFDFLKIKNVPSQDLESITGFFINPEAAFSINRILNRIEYLDKTFNLEPNDLFRTESNLFLSSDYFGKVFGLECIFNFRSLSVSIKSKLELPVIREMRQEEMRQNRTRLNGEVIADTVIGRTYPRFKFGMADWSVDAAEEINGKSDVRLNLALGAMVAGGEANASLYYNNNQTFTEKQQRYLWRYVNNDFSPLRQVMAGKITTNSISSIYDPVVGIQLTNTSTIYRRSFGSYTLSDRTEPGWIVELYVNNVLVDYKKADASGFFTFQVPLVYGNSSVRLKFFGPWGEERVREQNIIIPFSFMPVNTMEYTVSAGIVEDSVGSKFTKANFNYGLTRNLTIGGGIEYLSSIISNPAVPYINASLRVTNNLLLSGEYDFRVRTKGTLSYRMPSNLQLDLNYTLYDKEQKAINFNYLEERKAVLSMPLKLGKLSTYQRFSVYQIVLPSSDYTTGEWLFSGSLARVSTNLTTYALFVEEVKPYVYSNLSLGFRFPGDWVFIPQAQYSYTDNKFVSAKMSLEKHLTSNAFLNLSYEKLFATKMNLAELGFRYDFSFAQTGASVRQSGSRTALIQYARGSIINDRKTKFHGLDNRTNVGKGGITVITYLDLNVNGKKDPGEPKAYGLNLHANGGFTRKSDRDTTIRITGLEPYTDCYIELDPNSFDNVSWRLPFQSMNVAVDPNILKNIEIGIIVAGEATGNILLEKDGEKSGLGRIIVNFYKANSRPAGKTITEGDGYFSYFGLAPGKYSVRVDTTQLKKLGMISVPEMIEFDIDGGTDGDIREGLDFTLKMRASDSTSTITYEPVKASAKKDTTYLIVHEVSQELVTITEDSYAIQMGAFRKKSNAESLRRKIEKALHQKVEIVIEDNYYKVRISDIKTRDVVDKDIDILHKNGINEVWVISLKAKKQQWVLTEKQDTITKVTESGSEMMKPEVSPEIKIQLGAFRQESNALALRDLVRSKTDDRVEIVIEDGYYKVRLSVEPVPGLTVSDLLKKLNKKLGKLAIKDFWVLPKTQPAEENVIITRKTIPDEAKSDLKIPILAMPVSSQTLNESKVTADSTKSEPTISLQVGVYHKQSDALRAQRKIMSKLKLPVEIIQRYEYYHVLIPGFFTREETYEYYPVLAGMGFPGVTVVERK